METTTDMFKTALTVSKIEDDIFRFVGLDIKHKDKTIELSMNGYVDALHEVLVRNGKKKEF